MKFSIRLTLILIACLTIQATSAKDDLLLRGVVTDIDSKKEIENCVVTAYKDGKKQYSISTKANGKYEFHLDLGYHYDIKFSRDQYVSKIVHFDLKNMTPEESQGGFQIYLPLKIFKTQKGFNKRILTQPAGQIAYVKGANTLLWDEEYSNKINLKIDAEFARLKSLQDQKYNSVISKAEKAIQSKKWKTAKKYYSKALKIKPEESLPKEKIQEIEQILQGQKK